MHRVQSRQTHLNDLNDLNDMSKGVGGPGAGTILKRGLSRLIVATTLCSHWST